MLINQLQGEAISQIDRPNNQDKFMKL